ncbi:MAG: M48 family metallopeptidase, partial [Clostridiales bacterium]|nr:M48 family metallopeptidase [Clostridiales bacterium]
AEGDKLILKLPPGYSKEKREKLVNEWLRRNLHKEIPALLEKWQPIIGVKILDWGIKNMKTRWGTCNIKARRIWLNLRLAQKPRECLEYVVVHELVHLLERKHNKVFKDYMSRFIPEWKLIKAGLNGS